mgnify:CR=1 FL=1
MRNLIENKKVTDKIKDLCNDSINENCGLILLSGKKILVEACRNVAKDPFNYFLISNKEISEKSKLGKIIAYYHSHLIGSEPSADDIFVLNKLNLPCIIYDLNSKSFNQINPNPDLRLDLIGRPFLPGYLDCSELVRDYYLERKNIILPKLDHPIKYMSWEQILEDWDNLQEMNDENYNFLENYFISNGFEETDGKPLKDGDIILCKAKEIKAPVHCMIYVYKDQVLHHPSQRRSILETYSNFYKRLSVKFIRHKG